MKQEPAFHLKQTVYRTGFDTSASQRGNCQNPIIKEGTQGLVIGITSAYVTVRWDNGKVGSYDPLNQVVCLNPIT